jgi:hypothetical protein
MAAAIAVTLFGSRPGAAQPIFGGTPSWVSADTPVSTGAALVDLDRDGWLDFVVGNGNDIYRQELAVYYNRGDGTLPQVPDWLSGDQEYNGHISIADVNGDGWPDVAVGLTMADPGTSTARVYLNNNGTFSSLPDWASPDEWAAFHVAFGDVNGDGRPDLAVGTGWPYTGGDPWPNQVYLNVDGTLESSASWVSDDAYDYGDIFFCDANQDGWLDLVGIGEGNDTWVYMNTGGVLATTATWHTTDNPDQFAVMGTYGDVNGDGWPELFVTDNTQLAARGGYPGPGVAPAPLVAPGERAAGSGNLRRYDGLVGGLFTTTPTWTYYEGYGSAVALADLDADGGLDVLSGSWWGNVHYFLNVDGVFPDVPDWTSAGTSVVEAIVLGDVNNDGLQATSDSFDGSAAVGRHLFQLTQRPVQTIEAVLVDDVPLGPDEFTADLTHGWVSVGPAPTTLVRVDYAYSTRLDMAVTNWDSNQGNHLYYYRDTACAVVSAPETAPGGVEMPRALSLVPANLSHLTALRVTLADIPAPYDGFNGLRMWIGPSEDVCENAGQSTPPPGGCGPAPGAPNLTYQVARLQCTPHCSDFGAAGLVYVADDELVPGGIYDVQAIDCDCDLGNEANYSNPLRIMTSRWGDLVSDCTTVPCGPPDGVVNVTTDVTAVLDKFKNLPNAVVKARADLEPNLPDQLVNITDVTLCLDAFLGATYPPAGWSGPAGCGWKAEP